MNLQISRRSLSRAAAYVVAALASVPSAHAQTSWTVIKDKTGACQISVPPTWSHASGANMANSPDGTTLQIIAGPHFRQFSDETLALLGIGKLYENSASRVFYVTKPNGGSPPLISYHVEVPGRQGSCIAQIPLTPRYSEDEAKKIAMSLAGIR